MKNKALTLNDIPLRTRSREYLGTTRAENKSAARPTISLVVASRLVVSLVDNDNDTVATR